MLFSRTNARRLNRPQSATFINEDKNRGQASCLHLLKIWAKTKSVKLKTIVIIIIVCLCHCCHYFAFVIVNSTYLPDLLSLSIHLLWRVFFAVITKRFFSLYSIVPYLMTEFHSLAKNSALLFMKTSTATWLTCLMSAYMVVICSTLYVQGE